MSRPRPAAGHPPGELLPRFGISERVAHWLLAASFASMLASGVFMGGLGPLGHDVMLRGHVVSAAILLAGVAVLIGLRRSRRPLRRVVRDLGPFDASDRRWLALAPRAYLTGGDLPPVGRFNAGQKVNARLVLVVLAALYVSGVGELGRHWSALAPVRFLAAPHGLAAGAAAILVAGHMYLALVHPATRPSIRGITLGSVRRDWAEHHHADWVATLDARQAADHEPAAPTAGDPRRGDRS